MNIAALASQHAGAAHMMDVALLLSSSDAFGKAAIAFILEALVRTIRAEYQGRQMVLAEYQERRHCEFSIPFGRQLA